MPAPVVPARLLGRDYGHCVTRRLPLTNSAFAFALALLVMITLHEWLTARRRWVSGSVASIHASTESDPATAVVTQVTILLGGPVWSLISGLVVLALPQLPARHTFWRLAVLWFGLVSVQEFSGYLVVGAFTDVGDIGTVYHLLGTPLWMRIVVLLIGAALMYLTARVAIARLLQLTDPAQEMIPQLRSLGLFGWLLGWRSPSWCPFRLSTPPPTDCWKCSAPSLPAASWSSSGW